MAGAAVVVAVRHAERPEDVLQHVDLEVVAAQALDDLAQKDDGEIGVAILRAGREVHTGVGHHGYELRPLRRLKGLPVLGAPWPCGVAEAVGVRHGFADGDSRDRTVRDRGPR